MIGRIIELSARHRLLVLMLALVAGNDAAAAIKHDKTGTGSALVESA